MTGLLVAGYVERHTLQPLLRVIYEEAQLPLGARVVGEVPDVPAPKWWKRARREAAQHPRLRTWWPRSERRVLWDYVGLFCESWPVAEPLWQVWRDIEP
jgi:hypothetical protein